MNKKEKNTQNMKEKLIYLKMWKIKGTLYSKNKKTILLMIYLQKGAMMKVIDTIALILVIIGAINWGLVGLFNFDLVAMLFGTMTALSRIVYIIIGIAGLWSIRLLAKTDED